MQQACRHRGRELYCRVSIGGKNILCAHMGQAECGIRWLFWMSHHAGSICPARCCRPSTLRNCMYFTVYNPRGTHLLLPAYYSIDRCYTCKLCTVVLESKSSIFETRPRDVQTVLAGVLRTCGQKVYRAKASQTFEWSLPVGTMEGNTSACGETTTAEGRHVLHYHQSLNGLQGCRNRFRRHNVSPPMTHY